MSDQRPTTGSAGAWTPLEEPRPPASGPVPPPPYSPGPYNTAPPGFGPPMSYGPSPSPSRSARSVVPTALAVVGILVGIGFIVKISLSMLDDDAEVPTFRRPTAVATTVVPGAEAPPAQAPAAETPPSLPPSAPPQGVITFGWVPLSTVAGGNTISWQMPEPNQIDGPRAARGVQANVTYWIAGGSDRPIRHDVAVLTDVEPGLGADEVIGPVLRAVQNDQVIIGSPSLVDGRIVVSFSGPYDGRMYLGKAYSWNGTVVLLSTGYFDAKDKAQAEADLAALEWFLGFGPP